MSRTAPPDLASPEGDGGQNYQDELIHQEQIDRAIERMQKALEEFWQDRDRGNFPELFN